MNEERMYETSGAIDEETSVALAMRSLWKRGRLQGVYIICGVMFLLSLYLVCFGFENAEFSLAIWLLLTCLEIYMPIKVKKSSRIRFREAAPGGKLEYTSSFTGEKMLLVNHTNGASGELPLVNVRKVFDVNGVWALVSKANMYYPVFAGELSETDRASLLALLKQNNPKIKIQLPKKK